jgi:hypothetical protein
MPKSDCEVMHGTPTHVPDARATHRDDTIKRRLPLGYRATTAPFFAGGSCELTIRCTACEGGWYPEGGLLAWVNAE